MRWRTKPPVWWVNVATVTQSPDLLPEDRLKFNAPDDSLTKIDNQPCDSFTGPRGLHRPLPSGLNSIATEEKSHSPSLTPVENCVAW